MSSSFLSHSSWASRIADLVVLTLSFLMFAYLMGQGFDWPLVTNLVFYVSVSFICLRLARRAMFQYMQISKRIFAAVLGNVSGLLAAAALLLVVNQIIPFMHIAVVLVVCSSIFAFLILGTLAPLIKTSRNDMMIRR
jgi:phosphatidylglycerophosphate synthase